MEFFKSNLWEIKKSSAVSYFGAAVALGHILIFVKWALQGALPLQLAAESSPICWPFIPNCNFWLAVPEGVLKFAYGAYIFFAALAFLLFLFTRLFGTAWFLLILAFTCFLGLYFRDFRLSSNEHYFWLLTTLIYLFIPNKENNLRFVAISFWLALGIIRLKPEWMTGLWIADHFPMPMKLAEWTSALSVLILMIAPFGLLFRDGRYLAVSSLTLIGLNIFYWIINDFFAPAIQLCALSFFILLWFEKRRLERDYIYQSFIRPEPSRLWVILVLLIFWFGQISPYLPYNDPWIRPFQEVVALTPLKTVEECKAVAFARFQNETKQIDTASVLERTSEELKCHTQLSFVSFKDLCNSLKNEGDLKSLYVSFYKRGFKDINYRMVFETQDICTSELRITEAKDDDGLQ